MIQDNLYEIKRILQVNITDRSAVIRVYISLQWFSAGDDEMRFFNKCELGFRST